MRVLWRATLAATVFAHQDSTSRHVVFELIRAPVGFLVADVACSTLYVGLAIFASERAPAIVSEMLERHGVEPSRPHFPGAGCALVRMRVLWRATLAAAVFAHQSSTLRLMLVELVRAPVRFLVADLACSAFHEGLAMQATQC